MRRGLALLALCAALTPATPAAAALQPVQRELGGRTLPRVRAGTIRVPAGHAAARARVIVRLSQPPLAAVFGRRATIVPTMRRLAVGSAASRAYLARLEVAQARAARALRRAIPSVRFDRRFRLLLDGLTVTLPARRLPELVRLPFVTRVYPSLAYTPTLDRSPSVIGADTLRAAAGATGEGVKIAVVDDGIDQTNPFFSPAGFAYPPGYPLGLVGWTTPKVIVARVFPGPRSGRAGRLPVDPHSSFHGTHVAGIAAGDEGTTAPAGADHPLVTALAGVAPRAQLGNYRVFTVPTAVGNVANTPELVAAFEAAVADGMDVINFSGGGAQTEPANDALVEAIRNVAAAGVVPVVAAGNDREEFGNGSASSPGTAPDAIAVAATSSPHVFAPALTVTSPDAPAALREIPFVAGSETVVPTTWSVRDQQLVDVASIVGRGGGAVEPHLCGPAGALASTRGQLPRRSLTGAIALVRRGLCPFTTKAAQARAAGAVGIVFVDNREGEANELPLRPALPAGMISNLDGELLDAYLNAHGGRAPVRIGRGALELVTGRSGVVTSFSSPGPTALGHALKPDVAAPGGQILSATLPEVARSRFAVFDGTSMATPHVAGAAALLLQLHPTWTPQQVKSVLIATAAPAWADTARTREAAVTLAGGGLVDLRRAAAAPLFTEPASLSFGDLGTLRDVASRGLLVRVADAGTGAGTWQVELAPQAATADAALDVPGTLSVPPGGEAALPVVARAAAGAAAGENYGFVILRRGADALRIPYLFLVAHPRLAALEASPLARVQSGDTRLGASYTDTYRYPQAPFGNAPDTRPMVEDGAEQLYVLNLNQPAANVGVAVVARSPGARLDPFVLGAKDENGVQGLAATPVDVNVLTVDYLLPVGAAGAAFPRQQAFYVAVDSGREPFTGRRLAGRYLLRSWVNDVTPPHVRVLTRRVAAGRPTLALRVRDTGAGVDPLSLVLGVQSSLVGASAYDPETGLALFPLPRRVDALRAGSLRVIARASDFQETKNVNTSGPNPMPNTRFFPTTIRIVDRPAVTWLAPVGGTCLQTPARLLATASSTRRLRGVVFLADGRRIGVDRRGASGLFAVEWGRRRPARGRHVLEAVAVDTAGRAATASRIVRVCR